jgi:hypothetical protein
MNLQFLGNDLSCAHEVAFIAAQAIYTQNNNAPHHSVLSPVVPHSNKLLWLLSSLFVIQEDETKNTKNFGPVSSAYSLLTPILPPTLLLVPTNYIIPPPNPNLTRH